MVKRVFVEKKPGFDIEAGQTAEDIRSSLGVDFSGLRLFNRYDIEGLSDADFDRAAKTILSEANVDNIYTALPLSDEWKVFITEYLPGQYDQRADSAAQCIALLTGGERPAVQTARVFALKGDIDDSALRRIENYMINPVESRLASAELPESLDMHAEMPENVKTIDGFTGMDPDAIKELHKEMGLAMSVADLAFCRDYFADTEKRDPTVTEIRVIDTYWSDHCRHTTFLTKLDNVEIADGPFSKAVEAAWLDYIASRALVYSERRKDITLMDMATIGAKVIKTRGLLEDLDESDEINACSIEAEIEVDGEKQKWLIQFKNETHNHPTEIEPFGGAATCLGGAIRDPLSGRAYVYQAMRVTGCGNVLTPFEDTLEGKLPQKKISVKAAQGYSSYGNQIGLSTGQVYELYDEGYTAKRMEIGAVVGASPKENVKREAPAPGDIIIVLGGRTGRDGCGGATGSSKAHDSSSITTCGAEVQKGNPPTERKLQRLFRNPEAAKMIKRCNDFGAGGVSVAIGELAPGLDIDLDLVRKKYEGLDGTELAISESQERMAVVLDKNDADAFFALAHKENLEAYQVAVVTQAPRLVMKWRNTQIVGIDRAFLDTNGVTQTANVRIAPISGGDYRNEIPEILKNKPKAQSLRDNLSRLEVCSQKGLSERFDSSIGAATVNMPFAGKYQLTPEEAMCAKVPVGNAQTDDATAMSFGFIPGLSRRSPFHGAAWAVTQSLAKLAAIGADPFKSRLTFQEYFEKLGSDPDRWGKPAAALLGALTAQLKFNTPSIGGKDSMSGSFNDMDVPPTLVSFALSMTKASKTGTAAFRKSGSRVVLLPMPFDSQTLLPDWENAEKLMKCVYSMVRKGKALSVSVVKDGGAAACVCGMAFGNGLGFDFEDGLSEETLFAPLCASFVMELADDAELNGIEYIDLGSTTDNDFFTVDSETVALSDLVKAYTGTLEPVFPTKAKKADMPFEVPLCSKKTNLSPKIKAARPKVVIPVFPGTNCEYDTARAFEKAGAQAQIIVIRNLTPSDIEQSIAEFSKALDDAQILMIPGGFSGGDEPDGSGKFIATTLRNNRVREAVESLLNERDGLILGICNGFQALIKTGLLPYGKIIDTDPCAPTLSFNNIGRHVSQMAYTRITSTMSPWLSLCEAGEIHAVPVSHGEGRFVCSDEELKALIANGQIATQYVDPYGNPCAEMPFNPNGSVCAVEGITSPDGRVLGKMGHSERSGEDLYKNVPFSKDQKIFASGVKHFSL